LESAGNGGVNLQRGAETEFFEFSAATLIGVIPDAGSGRVGVISGNEFTPLSVSPASASPFLNTW
jgi:hypothetical protein